MARRLNRRANKAPAATAQELQLRAPRIELNETIKVATLNVRGLKMFGKRQDIEHHMKHKGIDILTMQETHIGEDSRETRTNYSWYFSGGTSGLKTIYHGVGIIIRTGLRNYVLDIETVNERLMTMKLRGQIDIHIIAAYAPTAAAPTEDKHRF